MLQLSFPVRGSSSPLTWDSASALLTTKTCQRLLTSGSNTGVLVNLSNIDFIEPDGLLLVIALIRLLTLKRSTVVYVQLPDARTGLRNLVATGCLTELMGLASIINEHVLIGYEMRSHPRRLLYPVNQDSFPTLMQTIDTYFGVGSQQFLADMRLPRLGEEAFEYASAIYTAAFHLSHNILKHSDPSPLEADGYVLLNRASKHSISLSIADLGRGLYSTLRNRVSLASPAAAITGALIYRLDHPEQEAEGIFKVLQSIHRWGGTCRVRSDSYEALINLAAQPLNDDVLGDAIRSLRCQPTTRVPGVQYRFTFRAHRGVRP